MAYGPRNLLSCVQHRYRNTFAFKIRDACLNVMELKVGPRKEVNFLGFVHAAMNISVDVTGG